MPASSDKKTLLQHYEEVKAEVANACTLSRREPGSVRLVIVTKFHPAQKIEWLLEAGHREFGESRAEELELKWKPLLLRYPDVKLHFIGQIQSRKIPQIIEYSQMIHSLDRLEIAEKITKECIRQNKSMQCLVQINTGAEPQKGGIAPNLLGDFLSRCQNLESVNITGLMCIPPLHDDPVPHFALLKKLGAEFNLAELSMGMSNDFEKAIAQNATMVRVGSKIMGQRSKDYA